MSGHKEYLHSDASVTKYAIKKIKSRMKELEVCNSLFLFI